MGIAVFYIRENGSLTCGVALKIEVNGFGIYSGNRTTKS